MTPVVLVLIVANVAVYLLQGLAQVFFFQHLALWPLGDYSLGGVQVGFEPWQLITSGFMHDPDNIAHLLLNMFALFMFGRDVELTLGSKRFSWLYGASIIAGSLAQLLVVTASINESTGPTPTVGASGGVFGVLLAFAIMFPKRKLIVFPVPIPMPAWLVVTGFAIIELASGVMGTRQGVAHFAHLGGMLGAAVVLLLVSRRRPAPPG
jgi:rhomboid family protein